MRLVHWLVPALCVALSGCGQSGGSGPSVYVLEGQQEVTLTPSVSTPKVQRGETVVLHVERRNSGQWKKISRGEIKPGQCWVYRPPQQVEAEVAQSVQWQVEPEGAVEFHMEVQMNQTRLATMVVPGKIQLTPVAKLQCEEKRTVTGPTIEIEVT